MRALPLALVLATALPFLASPAASTTTLPGGSVVIEQLSAGGVPVVDWWPAGCSVAASGPGTLTVTCPGSTGLSCGPEHVMAGGPVSAPTNVPPTVIPGVPIPGESITATAQCTGGPAVSVTSPFSGVAWNDDATAFLGFPWTCRGDFTSQATGVASCWTPNA